MLGVNSVPDVSNVRRVSHVHDVARTGQCFNLKFAHGFGDSFRLAIRDDHKGAFFGESFGCCQTETVSGSGDQHTS